MDGHNKDITANVKAFSADARELVKKYGYLRQHLMEIETMNDDVLENFAEAAILLHHFIIDILPVDEELYAEDTVDTLLH